MNKNTLEIKPENVAKTIQKQQPIEHRVEKKFKYTVGPYMHLAFFSWFALLSIIFFIKSWTLGTNVFVF